MMTIILGIIFVMMQAHEYWSAYAIKSLRLESGIYGTTFFMLTGFHALHVSVGIIALSVILWRLAKGDFNAGYGTAWFLGSWLMGVLYDTSIHALIIFSVAAEFAAMPFLVWVRQRLSAK